ncbi:TetR/AcrR family transcriptional regulator, partial [Bacillus sp. JJ722]|uniref:TetR/AcrR family transcriptional regulator n=1 Tax=Bacillus sp. JJ722 TaxID=3122973 RepID=UPI002FFF07AD
MEDPRAERSRAYLKEALLILLLKHSYENIKVEDIARKAGVNRSTFYAHYKSKNMLLKDVIYDTLEKIHTVLY